jgi:AGZA family xanthine/uracil permease-like MFS transporter
VEVNNTKISVTYSYFFCLHLVKAGPFPIAIVALIVGTGLGWATSLNKAQDVRDASLIVKAYAPTFPIRAIFANMNRIGPYLSTTIPTAISIAIGTIQCVESAKRAGDFYPTRESMFADGIGTIIASLSGSFLGMTSKSCCQCHTFT